MQSSPTYQHSPYSYDWPATTGNSPLAGLVKHEADPLLPSPNPESLMGCTSSSSGSDDAEDATRATPPKFRHVPGVKQRLALVPPTSPPTGLMQIVVGGRTIVAANTTTASSTFSPTSDSGLHHPGQASPPRYSGSFKAHHQLAKNGVRYRKFPKALFRSEESHPQDPEQAQSAPPSMFRAFVGQTRFGATADQVAWIFSELAGPKAAPCLVTKQKSGCCWVLHFNSQAQLDLALALNRRVLFDVNGVWFMTEEEDDEGQEAASLARQLVAVEAALRCKASIHKHRLPRGCLVVEPSATPNFSGQAPHQGRPQHEQKF